MNFTTKPIYYFTTPRGKGELGGWAVAAVLIALFWNDNIFELVSSLLVLAIAFFIRYSTLSSHFTLRDKRIIFSAHLRKDERIGYGPVRITSGISKFKSVTLSIGKIERIEYSSNEKEVPKDIGHLRLFGEILTLDRKGDLVTDVYAPSFAEIHGVTNFKSVSEILRKEFFNANHVTMER